MISVLGIPRDTLSASLVSFLKYFSLPLDTELIRQLRREVLALEGVATLKDETQKEGSPKAGTPGPRREAAALAATVARDKGLSLSPEALGEYAAAIGCEDGPEFRRNREARAPSDGEAKGPEDRRGGEGPPQEAGDGAAGGHRGSGGGRDSGGNDGTEKRRTESGLTEWADGLSPERLREPAAHGGLLDLLNKLPGKNGRRWMVLPFSFAAGGVDFKVSLRILLSDTNAIPWNPERIVLVVKSEGRRWSFMLEKADLGDTSPHFARAEIGVYPPPEKAAVLEEELRNLLKNTVDHITIGDLSEAALFEGAGEEDPLPAINEKV
jgi:hypothetical protein